MYRSISWLKAAIGWNMKLQDCQVVSVQNFSAYYEYQTHSAKVLALLWKRVWQDDSSDALQPNVSLKLVYLGLSLSLSKRKLSWNSHVGCGLSFETSQCLRFLGIARTYILCSDIHHGLESYVLHCSFGASLISWFLRQYSQKKLGFFEQIPEMYCLLSSRWLAVLSIPWHVTQCQLPDD